ncbi:MAG: hypothetical protein P2A85_07165 [Microcoleus anatoxicus]|uniref:KGGVGR-motif variant AAA ATPase n=1 Tax=Microcoleus anatoxicus TaxID=2705319 RepID=UPI003671E6E1
MLTLLHQADHINSKLASLKKDEEIIDYRVFLELNMEIDVYLVITEQSHKGSPAIQEIQQYFGNLAKAYRINLEIFSEDEVKDDPALENIFIDDNESKLDLGLKYRFHSLLETQNNLSNNNLSICPVVTFYSYKGGMGRTTSLCSYALNAALNEKKKVVIIDCDFEAPGYLNFFRLANDLRILSGQTNGVVEYFLDRDFSKSQSLNIDNYYIRLNKDSYPNYPNQKDLEGLDNIYIFPAGNLSENSINTAENQETTHRDHYLQGLARLDLSSQDKIINGFKNLLEEIDTKIKPDLILIDSRTGFNDIFGTTALVFSKAIVALFGSSQQTKPGLYFLLNKFYQTFYSNDNSNNVKLLLVNSILPEEKSISEIFYNRFGAKVRDYLDELQDNQVIEDKYLPIMSPLRRNPLLEAIGLMEENEEEKSNYDDNYIKFVKDKKFEDYKVLFDHIDSIVFPAQQDPVGALESKVIRDSILRELQKALPSPYAEDTEIKPEQFFYRKCMDELFDKNKFIVQGFKGTGKTYLYKALKEDRYVEILKRRARCDEKIKFIDIISETGTGRFGNKSFDIDTLRGFEIKEEDSYYKRFWVVHTWNSVMLDASEKLNYSSKLTDKVKAIEPDTATATRFHKLINQPEQYSLIEEDLKNLDSFLENKNIKLFVLYDQLDNLVKVSPERWKKIVSPLVAYWWSSARFQNIFAKIFIRTDLIPQISGTNTERLKDRITKIEWSRDEIYSYFFKQVFINKSSKTKLFELMRRGRVVQENFIEEIEKILKESEDQIPLERTQIEPFMTVFFGNEIMVRDHSVGIPYEWFFLNLQNADQVTISLRPFINLIRNAIESSLEGKNEEQRIKFYSLPQLIHYPVLHHTDYCNDLKNRDRAVEAHFNDLTREAFNEDLVVIIEYLRESQNAKYKYIYLEEAEIKQFLKEVSELKQSSLKLFKKPEELLHLLEVNGIIHKNPKPGGSVYYFAQLYKFWLGLKGRKWQNPSYSRDNKPKLKPTKQEKPKPTK